MPFKSKKFIDFCDKKNITQSMSRAGCPYDNAVMERFLNTFKCEFYYLYNLNSEKVLYAGIEDFILKYNYCRCIVT